MELAAEVGRAAAFDLSLVAPKLPPYPCPTDPATGQPTRYSVTTVEGRPTATFSIEWAGVPEKYRTIRLQIEQK